MAKEQSVKDLVPSIEKIANLTSEIRKLVEEWQDCTIKTYYMSSVENLEKKNEKYLGGGVKLSAESRKQLNEFRKKLIEQEKAKILQIPESEHKDLKKKRN